MDTRAKEMLQRFDAMAIPLRLAVARKDDVPLIVPLWFSYEGDRLRCATKRHSYLVRCLQDADVSFDISTQKPPYRGVSGRASVTIRERGAGGLLEQLIGKYVPYEASLSQWLMRNSDKEVMLELEPTQVRCWDYSHRMT